MFPMIYSIINTAHKEYRHKKNCVLNLNIVQLNHVQDTHSPALSYIKLKALKLQCVTIKKNTHL